MATSTAYVVTGDLRGGYCRSMSHVVCGLGAMHSTGIQPSALLELDSPVLDLEKGTEKSNKDDQAMEKLPYKKGLKNLGCFSLEKKHLSEGYRRGV